MPIFQIIIELNSAGPEVLYIIVICKSVCLKFSVGAATIFRDKFEDIVLF